MIITNMYTFFNSRNWYTVQSQKRTKAEQSDVEKKDYFVTEKLSAFYGYSRYDLIVNLDEVCSYCGMPIRDDAHVEHIKPKSYFPAFMLLWNNFLIACRDCNDRKSNKPSGGTNDTDADYIWPHTTLEDYMIRYTLSAFHQSKIDKNDKTPNVIDSLDTVFLVGLINTDAVEIKLISHGEREATLLRLDIYDDKPRNIAVTFQLFNTEAGNAVTKLFKMDRYAAYSDVSDRRMIERTHAWVQALDALNNLISVKNTTNAVRQALLDQIGDTMRATGFWSIWAEVLIAEGPSMLNQNEYDWLKAYLKGNSFAGTDLTRLYF
ncbi:MAG: hypothetical protein AUG51_11695 [Acidobacteria bacterium 13_1_20CM_3_53_8]|nr:MAG: hypothetical protein AUG51_11695 [Acidobacteria bacterium 13_1_20CM_3_53_8]